MLWGIGFGSVGKGEEAASGISEVIHEYAAQVLIFYLRNESYDDMERALSLK